jgi:hypothetical protein
MSNKQTIIGKTAPVPLGQQRAVNSLPVVFAEDQPPIPVEEQNKIQSEVALSLLGIPRAEVALGIFADVNTYDINPTEWSQSPLENEVDGNGSTLNGLNHLFEEAGAELVAQEGRTTILSSKRFFRYQPGRVSSSTMGVKMNTTLSTLNPNTPDRDILKGAPSIKKWGIFDKYDGYYFEIANGGDQNDFRCVRRTQALTYSQPPGVESTADAWNKVVPGVTVGSNIKAGNWGVAGEDPVIFRNGLAYVAAAIHDPSLCYSPDDVRAVEGGSDLNDYEYDEGYAVRLAYRNLDGNFIEHMQGRQFQFPFDQKDIDKGSADYLNWQQNNLFLKPASEYIRLDAHCRWEDLVTNLSRGGGAGFSGEIGVSGDTINAVDTDSRFKFDIAPNEQASGSKVWNLLVSVQGSSQVTNAQYSAAFPSPHRTQSYDVNNTSSIGRKNITLKEWFKLCVPPEYRVVYEWRPVRAMFSGDQLNGEVNTTRWSDVSTANVDPTDVSVKRPGDPIFLQGSVLETPSQYNVDFTKVTMWKIEFSWYGAVGALFLCYVPVANGEARWVRVHHMRASNQLDVASLGNATLPITYLTHGGLSSGLTEASKLTKYGASYYIDGGDKGTVKLLSKSSDYSKNVKYSSIKTTIQTTPVGNNFEISFTQAQREQLIGSYLKNNTTTKVIWVENGGAGRVKLFFSQSVASFTNGDTIELVVPRRQRAMIALRAKDNVVNTTGTPIRNRLQLYPIKYGIGLTDPTADSNVLSVNFLKNPLLITNNLNNSALTAELSIELYSNSANKPKGFDIGSGTIPRLLESNVNISSGDYATLDGILASEGDYFFSYMRSLPTSSVPGGGFPANPGFLESPALIKFFKKLGEIYVQNYQSKPLPTTIYGSVLYIKMYTFSDTGDITLFTGNFFHSKFEDQTKWNETANVGTWESIAALSGASVSQDFRLAPVPETGSTVFSLYVNQGGSQFDLQDYFAYNKEYISYPLTNEVDILCAYAFWESTSSSTQPTQSLSIVNSLTWEEQ